MFLQKSRQHREKQSQKSNKRTGSLKFAGTALQKERFLSGTLFLSF